MFIDVYELRERDPLPNAEQRSVESGAWTTAETAECTCPDFCERDHDID
jgi:hypothetical protein